jgi:sugar lactone lactonase YvrE
MKNTVPALVCLLLAACGGGGGGSSTPATGTTTPTTPTTPVATTYKVAGLVVGLEASGLVVADNTTDMVTVAKGATSFVFGTQLAAGAAYSVTFASQPMGFQACSITGAAAGTVSADVSLPVICTDAVVSVSTLAASDTAGYADGTGSAAKFGGDPTVVVAGTRLAGLTLDGSGNVYVADSLNSRIRKVTTAGVVTTYAGSGAFGSVDGTAATASFSTPAAMVFDTAGNMYVTDTQAHNVRKIATDGTVSTFAGSGIYSSVDGTGIQASFRAPSGIVIDSAGNLYVGDAEAHVIRKITSAGVVTTFAGTTNVAGSADGTGTSASFNDPAGLAIDASGNLFVADAKNNKIRKITPAGVVTTYAGTGVAGSTDATTATAATFNVPVNLSIDSDGFLYVADTNSKLIRKISPSGKVSTVAGGGAGTDTADTGAAASFVGPTSVVFDKSKTLYVADGNKIRKLVRK